MGTVLNTKYCSTPTFRFFFVCRDMYLAAKTQYLAARYPKMAMRHINDIVVVIPCCLPGFLGFPKFGGVMFHLRCFKGYFDILQIGFSVVAEWCVMYLSNLHA